MEPAVVETANMAAANAEINAADFHVGHLLGLNNGISYIFLGNIEINDLPFADAAGSRLAETDNAQHAGIIQFANNGANFGCSNIQADHGGRAIKHAFFYRVKVGQGARAGARHWSDQKKSRERNLSPQDPKRRANGLGAGRNHEPDASARVEFRTRGRKRSPRCPVQSIRSLPQGKRHRSRAVRRAQPSRIAGTRESIATRPGPYASQ